MITKPPLHQSDPEAGFERRLGWFSSTSIVVGAIIGVGIFFSPQDVAKITGSSSAALLAWGLGGGIALLGALVFAELGGAYARTGGQYQILRDAYGPPLAFIYVFCNATAIQAGAVAIIASISANHIVLTVTGDNGSPEVLTVIGLILILALMITNYFGVRWGALTQNITVVGKVATLLLVVLLAAFFGSTITDPVVEAESPVVTSADEANPGSTAPQKSVGFLPSMLAALVSTLFAFGGWQHALWVGGEVKNPRRNVPLAILLGVSVVIVSYLLFNWALFRLLGYHGVVGAKVLTSDAVSTIWPQVGSRLVAAAIAVSGIGVLNAQLLSGPRLICGMARDGRFFPVFGALHTRYKTPFASIVLIGGIGIIMLALVGFERTDFLVNGVVMVDTVFFIATGASLIVLRVRKLSVDWQFRLPLFPLVPILFVLAESAVLIGAFALEKYRMSAFVGVIWIAAALAMYWYCFRSPTSRRVS